MNTHYQAYMRETLYLIHKNKNTRRIDENSLDQNIDYLCLKNRTQNFFIIIEMFPQNATFTALQCSPLPFFHINDYLYKSMCRYNQNCSLCVSNVLFQDSVLKQKINIFEKTITMKSLAKNTISRPKEIQIELENKVHDVFIDLFR